MGARFNSARTPEQTDFAIFWAANYVALWNRAVRDLAAARVHNTPNYPDYTSGANNVTGAATRALALYFGSDEITFTVFTTNAGAIQQMRTYSRFSDAAEDVVTARVFEGIHFRFADAEARKQGRHVAQWAFGHFLKPLGDEE